MNDHIVIATAADHRIRAYAASTRLTVEQAHRRHDTSPVVTAALGRLLTAAAMMGAFLKSDKETVSIRVSGDGPVKMLAAVAGGDDGESIHWCYDCPDYSCPSFCELY